MQLIICNNSIKKKILNDTCYTNTSSCSGTYAQTGWVFKSNVLEGQSSPYYTWLLSPDSGNSHYAFYANSGGYLGLNRVSGGIYGVRPVVYLKSNIKIAGGTGEVGSEYTLEAM